MKRYMAIGWFLILLAGWLLLMVVGCSTQDGDKQGKEKNRWDELNGTTTTAEPNPGADTPGGQVIDTTETATEVPEVEMEKVWYVHYYSPDGRYDFTERITESNNTKVEINDQSGLIIITYETGLKKFISGSYTIDVKEEPIPQ